MLPFVCAGWGVCCLLVGLYNAGFCISTHAVWSTCALHSRFLQLSRLFCGFSAFCQDPHPAKHTASILRASSKRGKNLLTNSGVGAFFLYLPGERLTKTGKIQQIWGVSQYIADHPPTPIRNGSYGIKVGVRMP